MELVSTAGKPTRTVRETTCGLDGTTQVGVGWVGSQLFFAVAGLDGTQYGLHRRDYASGRTYRSARTIQFRAWAQRTPTTAYALRATKVAGARDETDTLPPLELVRVTGIRTDDALRQR